jgi:UDP-N-acetylmuramoylalanine--D-glutamate ligase
MQAFDSIVWIAGGQAKGTTFDDLVATTAPSCAAPSLLGVDRQVIADALARHAPEVPVIVLDNTETGVMDEVVALAGAGMARPGDTVLLAPGLRQPGHVDRLRRPRARLRRGGAGGRPGTVTKT